MDIRKNNLPNTILQEEFMYESVLHNAVETGDDKKLEAFLKGIKNRAIKEPINGNTPLHEAARRGYSRCLHLLCEQQNLSEKKPKFKCKLEKGEAKALLRKIMLNMQNNDGFTALHLASQNGHNQSCRELLLAGADPNVQNNYGDTALHTACRYGHAGATRILLSAFCSVNKVNLNGDTALHISCAMGKRKLTRILFEAGCDMHLRNAQDERALDIAIRKKQTQILEILNNLYHVSNRHSETQTQCNASSGKETVNEVNWSPYGCHYFPEPRVIPSLKFESFPKKPLKSGEQYYLDLAGRICIGPIGVGNTCYCGPFFRHFEEKFNVHNKMNSKKLLQRDKKTFGQRTHYSTIYNTDKLKKRLLNNQELTGGKLNKTESFNFLSTGNQRNFQTNLNECFHSNLARCHSLESLNADGKKQIVTLRYSKSYGSELENYSLYQSDFEDRRNHEQIQIDTQIQNNIFLIPSFRATTKINVNDTMDTEIEFLEEKNCISRPRRIEKDNQLIPNNILQKKININNPNMTKILKVMDSSIYTKESFPINHLMKTPIIYNDDMNIDQTTNLNCLKTLPDCTIPMTKLLNNTDFNEKPVSCSCFENVSNKMVTNANRECALNNTSPLNGYQKEKQFFFDYKNCNGVSNHISLETLDKEFGTMLNVKRRPIYKQNLNWCRYQNSNMLENNINSTIQKVEIKNSEIKLIKKTKCDALLHESKVKEIINYMDNNVNIPKTTDLQKKQENVRVAGINVDSESSEDEFQKRIQKSIIIDKITNALPDYPLNHPPDTKFYDLSYNHTSDRSIRSEKIGKFFDLSAISDNNVVKPSQEIYETQSINNNNDSSNIKYIDYLSHLV